MKRLEYALIALLFLGTVALSAYQLGVFSVVTMASIHPQSQAIAADACSGFAKQYGLELVAVQVRVGVQVAEVRTDTAICEYRTGTLPYTILYDLEGQFQSVQ